MATEAGGPAPAGDSVEKKEQNPKPKEQQQQQQPAKPEAPAAGEKKLSNAELKKKQKEEKAARRAQAKAAQTSQGPDGGASHGGAPGDAKGGKPKPKQDGQSSGSQQQKMALRPAQGAAAAPKVAKPSIPDAFSHLSMARRINMMHADKDVNPAVLVLGQHMSTFEISDSITRLEATLHAFKKVLNAYTTPIGTTFSRHFTSHVLNPQIEYLTACRPMCFSMGNAIRWLKLQISRVDIDLPDSEAKELLCDSIDNFIRERITLADRIISETVAEMISDGDAILTYAHHHLVERALLRARDEGKEFSVTLIDDAFERVGLAHAEKLSAAGIAVTYVPDMGALRPSLNKSTHVLVAAEAMFSNGAMYARAGTCDIATVAADLGIQVMALCETINFTERVSIDSLTYNEIDPERCTDEGFRLLFDTTKKEFISLVVTELGYARETSLPAMLRKMEEL
ncbi:hypothetical protein B0I35DRAFT_478946 [Stachybotrys elegans]|uniref:Translation initiation factor eIF2B subunit delta n=1 Tax=Stachybotrys elegans TaxID=80388 RepID=A0A8K0SV87_9HYPO|nr:hypothetical protein B0I35DRAFT_478946 [Stachybotrys elegans]